MIEYFYTLDLGQRYGSKLEELAAQASYEDVEAFAAMILCRMLDQLDGNEPHFEGDRGRNEGHQS